MSTYFPKANQDVWAIILRLLLTVIFAFIHLGVALIVRLSINDYPVHSSNEVQLHTSIYSIISCAMYVSGALYHFMKNNEVDGCIWVAKFVIEDILAEHKKRNAADRPTEYTLSDGTKVKIPAKSAKKD
jgi:hypothetical protein